MITCKFEDGDGAKLRHVVVDGILVQDDKVFLIKRAKNLLQGGKYALPGGFLDRDETIDDAVRREVKEETGYETKKLTLFNISSNPDRGDDRQNVAFIFIVEVGEKTADHDDEVEEADWHSLDSLPEKEEIAFDHHIILERYKKYKSDNLQLPIISQ